MPDARHARLIVAPPSGAASAERCRDAAAWCSGRCHRAVAAAALRCADAGRSVGWRRHAGRPAGTGRRHRGRRPRRRHPEHPVCARRERGPVSTRCEPPGTRSASMAGSSAGSTASRRRGAATDPTQGRPTGGTGMRRPAVRGSTPRSAPAATGSRRCAVEGWVWSTLASSDTPPRVAAPRPLARHR